MPQAQKLIGQLLEMIQPMKSSVPLGVQPEEREVTKNGESAFLFYQTCDGCLGH